MCFESCSSILRLNGIFHIATFPAGIYFKRLRDWAACGIQPVAQRLD